MLHVRKHQTSARGKPGVAHSRWTLQDEEFARKTSASLPPRILSKQLKILVTGQPETGRTTTIRNLFASIAQDEHWAPVDTENLTMDDFRQNPAAFTTVIEDRPDVSGRLSMSYIIQVEPLTCDVHAVLSPSCKAKKALEHAWFEFV
jgi:hypothetical protein